MVDFMTALRSRAREQERSARLSGRAQTPLEVSAPYVALAETAGERFRTGKSVELQEKGLEQQGSQFGEQLSFEKTKQTENLALERERLAEARRAEEERIRVENAKLQEMQDARKAEEEAARQAIERDTPSTLERIFDPAGLFTPGGWCIVISACTDPYSYEVNLARKFRNRFMGPETLTGYYALASILAPWIDKFKAIRWLVYRLLVKRLVDYGQWIIEGKHDTERFLSKTISKGFLGLCKWIGKGVV